LEEQRRAELRNGYLDHLLIYLATGNPDSTFFGTLIDSWYAYHRGGIFIKPSESPRTLTNPSQRLELQAMRELPFISQGAGAILFEGASGRLVKEHTIPRAHLRRMMIARRGELVTRGAIEAYLCAWYHVAALTLAEHKSLGSVNDCMPPGWNERDCLARYSYARIERYVVSTRQAS
jgi:hypothetical protein